MTTGRGAGRSRGSAGLPRLVRLPARPAPISSATDASSRCRPVVLRHGPRPAARTARASSMRPPGRGRSRGPRGTRAPARRSKLCSGSRATCGSSSIAKIAVADDMEADRAVAGSSSELRLTSRTTAPGTGRRATSARTRLAIPHAGLRARAGRDGRPSGREPRKRSPSRTTESGSSRTPRPPTIRPAVGSEARRRQTRSGKATSRSRRRIPSASSAGGGPTSGHRRAIRRKSSRACATRRAAAGSIPRSRTPRWNRLDSASASRLVRMRTSEVAVRLRRPRGPDRVRMSLSAMCRGRRAAPVSPRAPAAFASQSRRA